MNHRTILVTGGAGFIGSNLVDRLIDLRYRVVVIDNESTGLRRNVSRYATYILGDVRNPDDVERAFELGVDAVFHIAGQASNIRSFDNPSEDLSTNVVGTLNILQACMRHKVPRLLFASSMTVYGHPDGIPVQETEIPRPISYYGITKYAAERYVLATAARTDLDFDFNATAFRMFNVYGERQRLDNPYQGVLGFFMGCVLRKDTITIHSDGEQTRDFVYIGDVVDAWLAAMDNTASHGQVMNLGFGQAISINRLVDEVLSAAEYSRDNYPIKYTPRRPGDQRHMTADISRARQLLGWIPRVSLHEGLVRTMEWARAEIEETHAR